MFIVHVCISEKNGKTYYKLTYKFDDTNDVFLTYDENVICTICDISPRKLLSLPTGVYDINLNLMKGE